MGSLRLRDLCSMTAVGMMAVGGLGGGSAAIAGDQLEFVVLVDGATAQGIMNMNFSAGGKKKAKIHFDFEANPGKLLHDWSAQIGPKAPKKNVKITSRAFSGAIDRNDLYSGCLPTHLTPAAKAGPAKGLEGLDLECDKVEPVAGK